MRITAALLIVALAATTLSAQIAMPDPSQIAGVPLPGPEMAVGTVSVRVVKERMGNNVAGQVVTLTGGGTSKTATTNAEGRAEFTGLAVGAVFVAEATVGDETLRSQQVTVPSSGGVRVALIAGIAVAAAREQAAAAAGAQEPARPGVVVFGGESRLIFEFQDDTLNVFYILDIVNNARTPVDTGAALELALPAGASQPTVLEGSSTQAQVRGERIVITGPFKPGTTSVQVGYSMPDVSASWEFRQKWPAAFEQVFLAIEKVGELDLVSTQLPAKENLKAEGDKVFVLGSGGRLNADAELVVQFSNLPSHSMTARYAAVGVGLAVLAMGALLAFRPAAAPSRAGLEARRTQLLDELVDIDQRQRAGRAKPRDAARRLVLMSDLERVLGVLDDGAAQAKGAAA